MEKGPDSRMKEDNPPEGQESNIPGKKYGTKPGKYGRWADVDVKYEINIKPDKNGRLKF